MSYHEPLIVWLRLREAATEKFGLWSAYGCHSGGHSCCGKGEVHRVSLSALALVNHRVFRVLRKGVRKGEALGGLVRAVEPAESPPAGSHPRRHRRATDTSRRVWEEESNQPANCCC